MQWNRAHLSFCFDLARAKAPEYLLAGDGVLHPLGGGWPWRPWRGGRESPPMTGGNSNG